MAAPPSNAPALAELGRLLADETRSGILCALMDGRAYTGSELARHLGVAPSTVSEHLGKLLDAAMIVVEPQGRHRYWRLVDAELAAMLEQLGAAMSVPPPPRAPAELAHARSCYDHLAGPVAVTLFDDLLGRGAIAWHDSHLVLTEGGLGFLEELGADVEAIRRSKRPKAKSCLDWTQRRHHLSGAAGKALLDLFFERGWVRRGSHPRSIEFSRSGRAALPKHFAIEF